MSATLHPTPTRRQSEVRAVETAPPADPAEREMRRWLIGLGTPFVLGAVFFALSIGTSAHWLLGVSLTLGPVLFLLATIYLCLTADTNGKTEPDAVEHEDEPELRAAA
jgi:hypothetical protein